MSHFYHHLADGAPPVVGRMFEAAMRDELEADTDTAAGPDTNADAHGHAHAHGDTVPAGGAAPHRLPFVADILAGRAGASITVMRRLTLAHDLYLADHNFVAPDVKPLADCFPVLPMTVSLEVMAETAACLVPGYGLLGIEDVTARRWIAVTEGGALDLRIEGSVLCDERPHGVARIMVKVHAGAVAVPAIEATLVFGTHYDAMPQAPVTPGPDAAPAALTLEAASVYATRQLFHGARFQGLDGPIWLGQEGASSTVLVKPASDWFAGQPQPQLLCDPALLDTVGQLIGIWSMQHGNTTFPIGLERIDFYGPTPAPGTRVPVVLRITDQEAKISVADIHVGDGAGGLWMRIQGWKSWQFRWPQQLVAFQRHPAQVLLSETFALPGARAADVCQRLAGRQLAGFDLGLLARHYLHVSEMAQFASKAALPRRQLEWLLGRVAAKDAARAWCAAAHPGSPMPHPAAFAIANDPGGQPQLVLWPHAWPAPCISIAHSQAQAIALAGAAPVGIDIEQIARRDDACVAGFTGAGERRLLAACAPGEHDAWVTRLWCAKEALGKRLGSGIVGAPQDFEVEALHDDYSLRLRHRPSGVRTSVATLRDGDFIIALDSPSVPVQDATQGEAP